MGWILDLIIIAIIAVCVFFAAKRGFVKTFVEFIGFVLAIYLSFTLSAPISNFAYNKFVEPGVNKAIANTVSKEISNNAAEIGDSVWNSLPGFVKNSAERFGVSADSLTFDKAATSAEIADTVCQNVVAPLAISFLKMIITCLLFLLLLVAVKLLSRILNGLFSFSIAGMLNTVLGGALGVIKGVIFAVVFIVVVTLIASLTDKFLFISNESIESSKIFSAILDLLPISK